MRIPETALDGFEYGVGETSLPGRNRQYIRVAPGPWILAELTSSSDEVSDDPESEYWEEVAAAGPQAEDDAKYWADPLA